MPHIHISLQPGRFAEHERHALAEKLTSSILAAEGLPETPTTRALTLIVVDEAGPATWHVAGEYAEQREELHAFVRITTFASLLDPAKRAAMLDAVNTVIVDAAGGDPLGGLGIWVVIDEIADGSWGVAGNPIGQRELQIVNDG